MNSTNKQLLLCLSDYLRDFLSDNYQHHYAKINSIVSHNSHHHHYQHYHTSKLNHHIDGGVAVLNDEKSHHYNHNLDYEALKLCIDYMYTSQLKVPSYLLPHVYTLAFHLSFDSIVNACGQYLIKHLTVDNCLSIRSFALDETLIQASSQCIEKDIEYILQLCPNPCSTSVQNGLKSSGSFASLNTLNKPINNNTKASNLSASNNNNKNGQTEKMFSSTSSLSSSLNLANIEFNHLPRINIELVGLKSTSVHRTIENLDELNQLCMAWLISELLEKQTLKLSDLCDNLNMLYMNKMDNTLHDCCDMNSSDCHFNDHINDYQKTHCNFTNSSNFLASSNSNLNNNGLSRANSSRNSPSSNSSGSTTAPSASANNLNSGSCRLKTFRITDQELNAIGTATPIKLKLLHANEVICTHQTNENSFITICTLNGKLVTLSVHILCNNNNQNDETSGATSDLTSNEFYTQINKYIRHLIFILKLKKSFNFLFYYCIII